MRRWLTFAGGVALAAALLMILPPLVEAGPRGGGRGDGGRGGWGDGRGDGWGGGRGWYGGGWGYPGYYGYGYNYGYPSYDNSYYSQPYYGYDYSVPYGTGYDNSNYAQFQQPGAGYSSFYRTAEQPDGTMALINVRVPANAEVWFNGQKTTKTGMNREFVTPSLQAGKQYTYDVKAQWMEGGQPVVRTRTVQVQPGKRAMIDFMTGGDTGTPRGEVVPREHVTPPAGTGTGTVPGRVTPPRSPVAPPPEK